jgi:hypothetical protein
MTISSTGFIGFTDISREFSATLRSVSYVTAQGGGVYLVGMTTAPAVNDVVIWGYPRREWGRVTAVSNLDITIFSPYYVPTVLDTWWTAAPNRFQLNRYYRGGEFVPSTAVQIPTAGTISFDNFRGASNVVSGTVYAMDNPAVGLVNSVTLPPGTWHVYVRAVGAGGGGGGGDENVFGSNGGVGGSFQAKYTITAAATGRLVVAAGQGGGGGASFATRAQGGFGGRSWAWTDTAGASSAAASSHQVHRIINGGWTADLENFGVRSPGFSTGDNTVTFLVNFPTAGNYRFSGSTVVPAANGQSQIIAFINNSPNTVVTLTGPSTVNQSDVAMPAGWTKVQLRISRTGGTQTSDGGFIRIRRLSDSLEIFNTSEVVYGGSYGGGYSELNGGNGGESGAIEFSGAGGGGGAASAILWYPNNDPFTGGSVQVLGVAPGGGGGSGTGRNVNPQAQGGRFLANWSNRGYTTTQSDLYNRLGDSSWFDDPAPGSRTPYAVVPTMMGQGHVNADQFSPPTSSFWDKYVYSWDGGAGGGGGAPAGKAGGYSERPGSEWVFVSDPKNNSGLWAAPDESAGSGGTQGWIYQNPSYFVSGTGAAASQTNVNFGGAGGNTSQYYAFLGQGGAAGSPSQASTSGRSGGVALRFSSVDDGIYPTP